MEEVDAGWLSIRFIIYIIMAVVVSGWVLDV